MPGGQSRKMLLVKVGLFSVVCLGFSLMVHGNHMVDTSTSHYGIWEYCLESASSCTEIDTVMHNRQQREINAARFFLLASHLVCLALLLVVSLAIFGVGMKKKVANIILVTLSTISFLFLLIGMSLATNVVSETLDDTTSSKVDWSFVMPWIGAGFGFLQFVEIIMVAMLGTKDLEEF
ncbi:uncharacterized protein LOC134856898 [Symsagittifera roscoffensis]|uniref:uncharacterized protein LOC134856898 n=1 Tax=Symsagittifera roscoffensis TaxID=84072 RepID=UPI00307CC1DD